MFDNNKCPSYPVCRSLVQPSPSLALLQIMSPACLGLTYTYWEELYILVAILAILILAPLLHLLRLLRKHHRGSAEEWYAKIGGTSNDHNMSGGLSKASLVTFLRDYMRLTTKDLTSLDTIMAEHDVNNDGVIDSESHVFIVCWVTLVDCSAFQSQTCVMYRGEEAVYLSLILSLIPRFAFVLIPWYCTNVICYFHSRTRVVDEFRALFKEARYRKMGDLYALVVRDAMMVVLLFHPFVSGKAMRAFQCREVQPSSANGTAVSYLETDMRIVCFDSDWIPIAVFAGLTLFFFSLGAPAVIFSVLYRRKHKLGELMTFKVSLPWCSTGLFLLL